MRVRRIHVALLFALFLLVFSPLFSQPVLATPAGVEPYDGGTAADSTAAGVDPLSEAYRSFLGLDSRLIVWIVAELHLMFGAFVLGVPIFAVILEVVGMRSGDLRYDKLAHELTTLLSAAFATTAALGGLQAFVLIGLYPRFMTYLGGVFHNSFYVYALMFFGEAFMLYLYYYSWERMKNHKGWHVSLGVLMNLFGIMIMVIANSWATFMMSPAGVDLQTGNVLNRWEAFFNPLWNPLNIHRFLANITFGGFVAAAYAAVKFLGTEDTAERAHYDWMGYVGNFVGIASLIFLPFAGYYLGREVYSFSPVMGNNMMGGAFSWTFILQAILIGMLFIGANFYLWSGMQRIPGAERYRGYVKYINVTLLICFAIWLTPHNLPLSAEEQIVMGGQYHPVLKYLGLMSAKNAAVNFIIISTFFSFLLYRRANKGALWQFSEQGRRAKVVLAAVALVCLAMLFWYAEFLFTLDPESLDLTAEKRKYFLLPAILLTGQMAVILAGVFLTYRDKGVLAQFICMGVTVFSAVFCLGVYGYVIMTQANAFLRNIAVAQFMMLLSCLIFVGAVDIFLFRKAKEIGGIVWGRMTAGSQYTLILICVSVVLLIALMGFIRSGLREDWHVYGVLRDTSPGAFTPDMAVMGKIVGLISFLFLGMISFVFWLGTGLGGKKEESTAS
ncbi:MAG: cytochrome ubiquinol oxidase subunit I [bacterium]